MIQRLAPLTAAIALAFTLPALAQTATPAKPAATKPAAKPAVKPAAKAPAKAVPAEAPLAAASDDQKSAAKMAHLGDYACEFNQVVQVTPNAKAEGYLDMKHKNQTWVMKPVLSSTGAVRLEDVRGRMLMIQIATKSMVMDTQIGQRLVDGCQHEKQRAFEAANKS
jgi:hypothetical protein